MGTDMNLCQATCARHVVPNTSQHVVPHTSQTCRATYKQTCRATYEPDMSCHTRAEHARHGFFHAAYEPNTSLADCLSRICALWGQSIPVARLEEEALCTGAAHIPMCGSSDCPLRPGSGLFTRCARQRWWCTERSGGRGGRGGWGKRAGNCASPRGSSSQLAGRLCWLGRAPEGQVEAAARRAQGASVGVGVGFGQVLRGASESQEVASSARVRRVCVWIESGAMTLSAPAWKLYCSSAAVSG